MGTISVSLPSDGETMDASDVNNPINTIVTAINGNLDSNNISAGGLTPANLVSGTGTSWAWQSWTPTWANLTIGNATVDAKYCQVGKLVRFRISVILGNTSSVGTDPTFTLPVASVSYSGTAKTQTLGQGTFFVTSVYNGSVVWASTTTAALRVINAAATYAVNNTVSATVPASFTTGSEINLWGCYEAA
jgi:hypothetical protein